MKNTNELRKGEEERKKNTIEILRRNKIKPAYAFGNTGLIALIVPALIPCEYLL